ncbi:MAG: membrane protein [Oligoflexia bacterium]|nr:MAG: membrane protein [Oligoflexia bacterium]
MIKWVIRELRGNYQFCLLFLLNISIGLVGFICLDAYKTTLSMSLKEQAKSFLSAELAVTVRRLFNDQEINKIESQLPAGTQRGHLREFFSMVTSKSQSRLVQVKAIDQTYPFYGQMALRSGKKIESSSEKEILSQKKVWVYPELLSQMKLEVGDSLILGDQNLVIADVITDDTSQTFRLASLAPKIYVGLDQIKDSSLFSKGSTISDVFLYHFEKEEPQVVAERIKKTLQDNTIQVLTDKEASEDSGRVLGYLTDYLGLVSLIGLFMSFLGGVYLYRSYLFSRVKNVAIYNTLGLTRARAQLMYIVQVAVLGLLASLVSLGISYSLLPVLQKLLAEFTPIQIAVHIPMKTVFLAIFSGVVISILVGLPFLRGLSKIQVSTLFQEGSEIHLEMKLSDLFFYAPAAVAFWSLTFWQANSFMVTNIFVSAFLGALIILSVIGGALLQSLRLLQKSRYWPVKQAVLFFVRRPISALVSLVSLGLGVLLIQLLPQLKTSIQSEVEMPKNLSLPSIFIFDIQSDQVEILKSWLGENNLKLNYLSPMVRGRIIRHNNQTFEERIENQNTLTREEESEKRFRNRAVNISYREGLAESEEVVQGKFPVDPVKSPNDIAELSLEKKYAERLGFKLGDELTFDVQGVEIKGKVTSFRKVKWNSFQPNFFILIQRGVLEDAPQTYLGALPRLTPEQVDHYQKELVSRFPNVSMIDVTRVINRVVELTEKMSFSLEFMALIALFAGFMVIYSMIIQQTRDRRWDLNMLKILGAKEGQLAQMLVLEFFFISLIGTALGALLGLGVSAGISLFLFEGLFVVNYAALFGASAVIILMCLILAYLTTRKIVREKPAVFFEM